MCIFQGYFSRTFQDQSDFPGLSRSWNFKEKNPDFPGGVGTLPDVKSYKQWLNSAWHRMLYSCIHMATAGINALTRATITPLDILQAILEVIPSPICWYKTGSFFDHLLGYYV